MLRFCFSHILLKNKKPGTDLVKTILSNFLSPYFCAASITSEYKNMFDIIHRIGIKAPADRVYRALTAIDGLAHWWTNEVEGSEETGGTIEFTFSAPDGTVKGKMVMEVQELTPHKMVSWFCVEGPPEWVGTTISFNLSEQDGQTIIIFGHRNWKEWVEFAGHCSMKWAVFLLSLRDYVETGKGKPSPDDLKIDNWN